MARDTREQWAKRVLQWQRSGLDAASFAARKGVRPERLRWWRWHLVMGPGAKRPPAQPQFVEVVLAGGAEQQVLAQERADIELLIGQRECW
jgi:hypothetical protein